MAPQSLLISRSRSLSPFSIYPKLGSSFFQASSSSLSRISSLSLSSHFPSLSISNTVSSHKQFVVKAFGQGFDEEYWPFKGTKLYNIRRIAGAIAQYNELASMTAHPNHQLTAGNVFIEVREAFANRTGEQPSLWYSWFPQYSRYELSWIRLPMICSVDKWVTMKVFSIKEKEEMTRYLEEENHAKINLFFYGGEEEGVVYLPKTAAWKTETTLEEVIENIHFCFNEAMEHPGPIYMVVDEKLDFTQSK